MCRRHPFGPDTHIFVSGDNVPEKNTRRTSFCRPGALVAILVSLVLIGTDAYSQRKVYKWVDEDGVIHMSDALPDGMKSGDAETITLAPQAPPAEPAQTTTAKPAKPQSKKKGSTPAPTVKIDAPSAVEKVNVGDMSLEDLDRRCDKAREEKIAPLRAAEIGKCKADRRNDPEWCERFNADYGDGGRTRKGTIRPRMFDDLPECVEALQERNRRG
jgi:hypothetical protein